MPIRQIAHNAIERVVILMGTCSFRMMTRDPIDGISGEDRRRVDEDARLAAAAAADPAYIAVAITDGAEASGALAVHRRRRHRSHILLRVARPDVLYLHPRRQGLIYSAHHVM